MLSIKKRQEYLKALGFYDGKIDGKAGKLTKQAYKDLQKKYFFKAKDKDGLYGKNTDILLQNAYNVHSYCKNFDLLSDKLYCRCKGKYCTGYPVVISVNLLKNIQSIRDKFGATTITSCLRCQKYNDLQKGSSKTSKHIKGRAIDFRNAKTKTLAGRKEEMEYWFKLSKPSYAYCNGAYRNSKSTGSRTASNMGTSIHGDVSK